MASIDIFRAGELAHTSHDPFNSAIAVSGTRSRCFVIRAGHAPVVQFDVGITDPFRSVVGCD